MVKKTIVYNTAKSAFSGLDGICRLRLNLVSKIRFVAERFDYGTINQWSDLSFHTSNCLLRMEYLTLHHILKILHTLV